MTRSPGRDEQGFTLLEILVVVSLIGIFTAAVAVGSLGAFSFDLENATEELEAALRQAGERAVATGEVHRWVIDLEQQRFRLEREVDRRTELAAANTSGRPDLSPPLPRREFLPVASTLEGRWRGLDSDKVIIDEVFVGGERYQAQTVAIGFGGDGSADAAQLSLLDPRGRRRLITVQPFTGEIEVSEPESDDF